MVSFMVFTLFAKEREKYCWMKSRICFIHDLLTLEHGFQYFCFINSHRNESVTVRYFASDFSPARCSAGGTPLVVSPGTFFSV